tara:strand:- start:5 stop:226 length:222 start_codon:yes stop_codon:yes gene_type:complete
MTDNELRLADLNEDLINALDNICELYEKQPNASDTSAELQECIRDARTLLNSIPEESSYIDTVLTDIQKCSIL